MPLLKTALVQTRILYEISQQNKQNYEELEAHSAMLLEVEGLISQIPDETNNTEELTVFISGLERVHQGLKKLDTNSSKLFFRPQPLLEKLFRFLNKLLAIAQHITGVFPDTSSDGFQTTQQLVDQFASEVKISGNEGEVRVEGSNGTSKEYGTPSVGKHFHIVDLLMHQTAREFWVLHFGSKIDSVDWEIFKSAFEIEMGPQTPESLKRLKKILGCDHTNNDMVSIFELADFSDEFGLQESFSRLLQRASSTFNPFMCDALSPDQSESESSSGIKTPPSIAEHELELKELTKDIKQNPLQVNTVWKGVCSEFACEIFDMTMHIMERVDSKIKGEIFWSGDVQTKFKGTVKDDQITFEEYKVVKGISIIPYPNSYIGKIDFHQDIITGKWHYNDQQGRFQLNLDVEASTTLLVNEKPDEDEKDNKPALAGDLLKQSTGLTKKWQHRYFVLERTAIRYSKSKENYPKKASGEIPLSHIMSVQETHDGSRPNQFEIITEDRTYHLQADNSEVRAQWIEALRNELRKFESTSMEMYNLN